MMRQTIRNWLFISISAAGLAACGGGGGIGINPMPVVTPPPPPPPPPPAPPPPPGPIPPDHLGLVSNQPFAVLGVGYTYSTDDKGNGTQVSPPVFKDVQFAYDASSNTYRIAVPGFQAGTLTNAKYDGTSGQPATGSYSEVTAGTSSESQPIHVSLPVPGVDWSRYSFTSYGTWYGQSGTTANGDMLHQDGIFAYGIPTLAAGIPVNGSASYSAQIIGNTADSRYWFPIGGEAKLTFDFGAGTLSGWMHPQVVDDWDGIYWDFGTYNFTQTVFSKGSTTFSGKFDVPGLPNADSSFNGQFTGPNAEELMARFQAPYSLEGEQGTIGGIWIGKKN